MTTPVATSTTQLDDAYHMLEAVIKQRVADLRGSLFLTDVNEDRLWEEYLSTFGDSRQYYNCNNCRAFITRYAGLVQVKDDGTLSAALWDNLLVPADFIDLRDRMIQLVTKARIKGIFYYNGKPWGVSANISQRTGYRWTHLHGDPGLHAYRIAEFALDGAMAEKREDYILVNTALGQYSKTLVEEALRILDADALTRSEKGRGITRWFLDIIEKIEASPSLRRNIIWKAVAEAPPGFAHLKNSVVGTLFDDIAAGRSFEEVKRRWSEKLHPLQYQRPSAPVSDNQIAIAEKKVKELGLERSFLRRFARMEDILSTIWEPRPVEEKPAEGGVFEVLKKQNEVKPMELPETKITWRKFEETILNDALLIEAKLPYKGSFYGLTTAVDPEAPAILQWDGVNPLERNPVAWYFYNGGSTPYDWSLGASGAWAKVKAVFRSPFEWQQRGLFTHHAQSIFFALDGAKDRRNSSSAIFPEVLKTDLREIRSVIERYSRSTKLEGADEASANGLAFNDNAPITVRVTTARGKAVYTIDRWD